MIAKCTSEFSLLRPYLEPTKTGLHSKAVLTRANNIEISCLLSKTGCLNSGLVLLASGFNSRTLLYMNMKLIQENIFRYEWFMIMLYCS